jgi:Cdc6-like AAA superfamily ATPase
LKDGRFISVIGLSNSIKFEKTLDPRVLSSMGFKKFSFPSHSADPILHIFEDRIELAFAPDSISKELLIECSIDAANVGGDIRTALSVLKTAAELATDDGVSQISKTHLKFVEETVQTEQIIKSVIEFPRNHKIVLASIVKLLSCNKTAYTGEVIQMCRALCEYIKIKPLHVHRFPEV